VRKSLLCGVSLFALGFTSAASAGDWPINGTTPFNWTGAYVGLTAGAAWGSSHESTVTNAGGYLNAAQAAAVNSAADQTTKLGGFTAGIEGGYNWQLGHFLVGVEADLQSVHLNGRNDGSAIPYPGAPGVQFVATSYSNTDWLFTARPRAGYVADNNWLFYITGGLALTQLKDDFLFTDSNGVLESGQINKLKTGYALGGGVEAPLTNRLTFKVDYLHIAFGDTAGAVTSNNLAAGFPGQTFAHTGSLTADMVRAGLNYKFGGTDPSMNASAAMPLKAPVLVASNWEVEAGARVWFSSGRIGAPQPLVDTPPTPPILASRLIYSGLDATSGETFARVDHSSGFFVKGILGAGGGSSGSINDEDFPAAGAYSNTLSSASAHIAYGTIDLGYTFLRSPGAKVGAFVGYNYYEEDVNTYGCAQLAGALTCTPGAFSPNFQGLSQDDHYNSLRVGLSSQFMLTNRLKLTTDVAYLPWVNFTGQDNHNARELLLPESASTGNGVMLEAILGYNVTEAWNVGVGGRYWAYNMRTGTTTFNFLGAPPPIVETGRYNSERYGMFVQSSYKWGGATSAANAFAMAEPALMKWSGFYVGGHVGGGLGNDQWSDPFGSTPGLGGATNVAGFGDTTRANGPLGGLQIGYDLQRAQWVFGVQADASLADLRGENTCFSGIGGINCGRVVNSLGTITGRVGYAWGRSLAYVKAGGARTNTTYNLYANTNGALALGSGSATMTTWGWTVGGGVEYALSDNWSTMFEYDHIDVPTTTVPFPTVALISAQNISVGGGINVVKVGVNYRFNTGLGASK
jgi:opacity protein-like surface antigen